MKTIRRLYFHLLIAVVLTFASAGAHNAAQINGVTVEGAVRSGSGDGVSGAQVRLIGPIIEDPTTYTPNPALTAEMRARIERFMMEARQMNAGGELMVNRAMQMEAEFLGLPMPPPPQMMGPMPEVSALTDGDGRFTFRNVRPGKYSVRASREGYWGATRPGLTGAPPDTSRTIDVAAGPNAASVSLVLFRGGTVSGRALDSEGRALSGLNVNVFRTTYQNTGRAGFTSGGSQTTNALGEYRFLLAPGEYYVAAVPRRPGAAPGPQDNQTRTFYPSLTDARAATPLTVKEGADHPAIDITVRNESTRTISGRVVMPSDNAGAAAAVPANLTFFLVPRDPNALADSGAPTYSNTAPDRSSGRFEIRALPPGAYDLIVSAQAPQAPAPRGQGSLPLRLMGRARIDIADRDIDDVTITIQPGVEVRARLLIDGKPPAPLPRWMIDGPGAGDDPIPTAPSVRLILQSRENYPRPFEDAARNSTYDPAEGFLFRGVPEGRFDFQLGPQSGEALSGNAYIADVREDGASILDEGLTLNGRTPGMIEVQVSTRGERITGTVRDAEQKTIAAARVALAPAQSRRQNLALFKTTVSDAAGNFTIEGIAPGEYKLFAWENAPNNAHLNSEFLANHELRGHAVTVKAGVPVKMDLQAIGQDKRP